MDVKYLNYIIAIANNHNMTKAAKELYVSQSSLSQYLTKLEKELGTPLFVRSKGDLSLTEAGELYVEAARKVVAIQRELYERIAESSGENKKRTIRVAATSNWGLRMMSEIIPLYSLQHPNVVIEISEVSLPALRKALVDGTVDVGLAADITTEIYSGQADVLRKEQVLLAVPRSHPFARDYAPGASITKEDILEHFSDPNVFFLLAKKGASLRMLSDTYFDSFGFKPNTNVETNSISATLRMVSAGIGIAFVAESCSTRYDNVTYYAFNPPLYRLNLMIRQKDWIIGEPEQAFMQLILGYFRNNTECPYLAEGYSISPQG